MNLTRQFVLQLSFAVLITPFITGCIESVEFTDSVTAFRTYSELEESFESLKQSLIDYEGDLEFYSDNISEIDKLGQTTDFPIDALTFVFERLNARSLRIVKNNGNIFIKISVRGGGISVSGWGQSYLYDSRFEGSKQPFDKSIVDLGPCKSTNHTYEVGDDSDYDCSLPNSWVFRTSQT